MIMTIVKFIAVIAAIFLAAEIFTGQGALAGHQVSHAWDQVWAFFNSL